MTGVPARAAPPAPPLSRLTALGSRPLPRYVEDEFEAYLECGLLEHGFLRVKCDPCQAEKLVAFPCKRRGFCPSCGARRMAETAALLVDNVLPQQPVRQWVLSLPFALRYRNASASRRTPKPARSRAVARVVTNRTQRSD